MTLYADRPARRIRQVLADLLVVVWVVAWVAIGREIHDRSRTQGQGASQLEKAGDDVRTSMSDAGQRLRKVPLVGDTLQEPFDKASGAGRYVALAGRDIQLGTDQLGQLLGLLTAALPILLVVAFWAQARARYARRVRLARAVEGYDGEQAQLMKVMAGLDLDSLGLNPRAQAGTTGPRQSPPPTTEGQLTDTTSGEQPVVTTPSGAQPTADPLDTEQHR